ncbi:ATP-binding protein [Woeseia oceani]|uniref:histidine kinase n=1 Tax=Woeseia oceani TaxID=1548547 RepID=A0A193LJJ9_9GAMM|nr:ATP-binding protein [Woeseia oceani]ANO52715.1 hypothetical protein BA177_17320 [Woeseia oceani]
MRITIATRIFLALTLVTFVILGSSAVATRWTFEQGFLEYVGEQEAATIGNVAAALEELYRNEGSLASLAGNQRRWNDLFRMNSGRSAGREHAREPGPGARPGAGPGRPGPPPRDPLELGRRIALTDSDGVPIVGEPPGVGETTSTAVTIDGVAVGYIVLAPGMNLMDDLDERFARKQGRSILIIAGAGLVAAAIMAALLAQQLTRPVRALAKGTHAVAAGKYETRIAAQRNDELGDLARDFNQLAEYLERDRTSRQQWVADIAHELRTPLSVLHGELSAIEDGVRTFDAASQQSLKAEVNRLVGLVGELHHLSVLDEQGLDDQREIVDVVAVLHGMLDRARSRLLNNGIQLKQNLPAKSVTVSADVLKLEQLFSNLIENTLRYTDTPGTLTVTCRLDQQFVSIEFADSAPGVPDSALPRLFDRLFRVDSSRSRATGGSGLGLSICKAIVEAHGGTITALHSTQGGLTVRMQLPVVNRIVS